MSHLAIRHGPFSPAEAEFISAVGHEVSARIAEATPQPPSLLVVADSLVILSLVPPRLSVEADEFWLR